MEEAATNVTASGNFILSESVCVVLAKMCKLLVDCFRQSIRDAGAENSVATEVYYAADQKKCVENTKRRRCFEPSPSSYNSKDTVIVDQPTTRQSTGKFSLVVINNINHMNPGNVCSRQT